MSKSKKFKTESISEFHQKGWDNLMWNKMEAIHQLLSSGFNVLYSDTDVVFLKNPLLNLEQICKLGKYDIAFQVAGGKSILAKPGKNSNFVKLEDINLQEVDIVIFMPCGFDINRSKKEIFKSDIDYFNILKDKKKVLVDGNKYFNRPGPDLLESTKILAEIIHPEIFPAKQNIKRWVYL